MNAKDVIPLEEAQRQVRAMGNNFGLLFLHFTKTLIKELGEEKGKDLVLKAVWSYGEERGSKTRERVEAQGLPLTVENFNKNSDLPKLGWDIGDKCVLYCSYAEPWINQQNQELGELYCEVDIAKFHAYNPSIKVKRTSSLLHDKPCCKYQFIEE